MSTVAIAPASVRHGDEFGGRDMAQFLVLPPRQRLETRDFPGLEVDERLVGQGQPALRQRVAQPALDGEAPLRLLEHAVAIDFHLAAALGRSEEHTSELQSLMRISYAVFCLKKKKKIILS